ncbi:L-rhamnose mutarotase [Planomicrobium soli]|uniref:L-rhamnose mutarotase n=1 Tax=Planomicrobium soli TaxID=1176648 RepID=A0A2P8GQY3_9BACL|nr:L-rhamnose mutarotase [Planomicrobium soli]PSL36367.1 L-rhamnose mutarotase [Planomicrobium soli]
MGKSNKFAWTWTIKEEVLDDYVKLHEEPWQEVLDEHTKAGIQNYSIFQNGAQFFYCFECEDVERAFAYIAESEACNKWNAITSTMVKGSFDFNRAEPIKPLREVFYLK